MTTQIVQIGHVPAFVSNMSVLYCDEHHTITP